MVYIERYKDSISCQIEMGIKEEAGNYLRALSERRVTDRRCEQRTGQRGVVGCVCVCRAGGWMIQSFASVSPLETEGLGESRPRSLF